VWKHCARLSLALVPRLVDVLTLSLGGGFKVSIINTFLSRVGTRFDSFDTNSCSVSRCLFFEFLFLSC
jgi:hypothetical protein